jgi:sugar phosphate isomerase/epimerase
MDTHFKCDNAGPSIEEQVRMVKEAGYDDYYFTDAVDKRGELEKALKASLGAGLGFNAAFQRFDVREGPSPENLDRIEGLVTLLPRGTRLEISLTCGEWAENVGNVDCDEKALAWLLPIASILEKHQIEGSLYPHFGFYLETFSDALRLAEKVNHPLIKVIFCGYHWYNVGKEPDFAELFAKAGDRLNAVNLCGSRHWDDGSQIVNGLNPSIEPLDSGTLPNTAIITELLRIGYTGPIGVQGYGVNAPASEALKRSMRFLSQSLS